MSARRLTPKSVHWLLIIASLLALASSAGTLGSVSSATAQDASPFIFKALLLPFPAGDGAIISGYDNGNRHTGSGNIYSLDFCQGAGCTHSTIGDPVLAPTDLELIYTDTSRNGIEGDPPDYHFFQIATTAGQRLCMAIAHFDLTATPVQQDGRAIYPQGTPLGTVLDYNQGDGSIPHIHLGLWTVPSSIGCAGAAKQRTALEFAGPYALDGASYRNGGTQLGPVVSHNGSSASGDSALGIQGQPVEFARWQTSGAYVFDPQIAGGSVYSGVLNASGAEAAVLDAATCQPSHSFPTDQDGATVIPGPTGTSFLIEGSYGDSGSASIAAIDPTGAERWRVELGNGVAGKPLITQGAIVLSGGVYQGENENDGFLVALDIATGAELWRTTPGFAQLYEPVLNDGLIYTGSWRKDGGAALLAFDPTTGAERLRKTIPEMWSISSPVFAPGVGLVTAFSYDINEGGIVSAFDTATGDIRWTEQTDIDVVYTPEILDGVAYAGSFNSEGDAALFAFDIASGTELWRFTPGESDGNGRDYVGSPTIVDRTLYIGAGSWNENGEGELYALDTNRNVLWQYAPTPALDLLYSPIFANGNAYAGSSDDNGAALLCLTGSNR